MPVEILCPQCQQRYRLKPDRVGKQFRCINCQNLFVPTAQPTPPPAPAASDETILGAIPLPPRDAETLKPDPGGQEEQD